MIAPARGRFAVVLVGVGGQGVLSAAKILGDAAHAAGHEVTVGQMHGMSQRGGSVECTVLIGPGRSTFLLGPADVVVAFEPLEAKRALPYVGPRTVVVMNTGTILPPPVLAQRATYPTPASIAEELRAVAARVVVVDGSAATLAVREHRTLNTVLLGAVAALGLLPIPGELLERTASHRLPDGFREKNQRAFELGRSAIETERERRA